ncbi:fasciclin domain-containing protein [Methanolobus sp. ZRKC2]|uniref:fasciclin domain-containing protein n=1 Tax=Methanolobus sp. ZRKC2 TaxID=3125783 RepID=UPI003255BFE8
MKQRILLMTIAIAILFTGLANAACYLNDVQDDKSEFEGYLNVSLEVNDEVTPFTAEMELTDDTLLFFPNAEISNVLLNVPMDQIASVTDSEGNELSVTTTSEENPFENFSTAIAVGDNSSSPITITFEDTWDGTFPENDAGYPVAVEIQNIGENDGDSAWVSLGFCEEGEMNGETTDANATDANTTDANETDEEVVDTTLIGDDFVETNEVDITESGYSPSKILITSGDGVTWVNTDDQSHTVTAKDGSFDSGPIEPGSMYSVLVSGTVEYTSTGEEDTYEGLISTGEGVTDEVVTEETTTDDNATEEDMADNVTENDTADNVTEEDMADNVTEEDTADNESVDTENVTIATTVADTESFGTLLVALETANLVDTLDSEGPFTVFAPTDEAFDKLPEGTVEALLADEEALNSVLTYHVVSGEYNSSSIVELDNLTTVQGENVTISVVDDTVMINNATVTTTDIETSNGVIHIIDEVLIPPSMVEEMDNMTNATDTNTTDANVTDTNVTDTNVTDANATDTNATDANATDSNETDEEVVDTALIGDDFVETNEVNITESGYSPSKILITSGDGVTWVNTDDQSHTVTAKDGSFDSGPIEPGSMYSVLVSGTVEYTSTGEEDTYEGIISTGEGVTDEAVTENDTADNVTEEDIADNVTENDTADNVTEEDMADNVTEEDMTDNESVDGNVTIAATVADTESFGTLLVALETANLVDTLDGEGPFTVFAPTDEAFDKLPEGTVEALLADEEALNSVLTYHVVSGEYNSSALVELDNLTTVQGENVTISVVNDTVMINNATVTTTDIETSNGVIHVIDEVLIPPSMVEEMDNMTNATDTNVTDANATDANVTETNVTDSNVTEDNATICYLNVVEENKSQYEGQLNATVVIDTETTPSTAQLDLTNDTKEAFPNSTVKTILLNVPADQIINANDSAGNEWTVTDIEEMENPFGFFLTMLTTDEEELNPFGDFQTMITVSDSSENATGPATIYFNETWNGTLPENEDGYVIATDVQNVGEAGNDSAWITLGFCEAENGMMPPADSVVMENTTCYLNDVEDAKSEYEGILNATLMVNNTATPYTAEIEIMNETMAEFPNATINTILLNVPGDMITDVIDSQGEWTILDQGEGVVLMRTSSNTNETANGPITIYFDDAWDGTFPENEDGYKIAVDFRNIGETEDDSAWVTCSDDLVEQTQMNGSQAVATTEIDGLVETNEVDITESGYSPSKILIASGDGVTWVNTDDQSHTVTAKDGSFDSGPIEPGSMYSILVTGTVEYTSTGEEDTYEGLISVGEGVTDEAVTEETATDDNATEEEMDDNESVDTGNATIAEIVADNDSFTILFTALETANLTGTLNEEGPFTVFAPTNEAFEKLPEGTVEALLADEEALTNVLTYHVVSGEYNSSALVELDNLTTVQGENVTISVVNDTVMVNNANVTGADIEASNGVIHVIDEVLIPPSMAEEMASMNNASDTDMNMSNMTNASDMANMTNASDMNATDTSDMDNESTNDSENMTEDSEENGTDMEENMTEDMEEDSEENMTS